jgi:hypothetical protein
MKHSSERKRLCAGYSRGKKFHRIRFGSPIKKPLQLIDRLTGLAKTLPIRELAALHDTATISGTALADSARTCAIAP